MIESLHETARAMVASGKGILAADESTGTISKRLSATGIDPGLETRRDYREMLFGAGEALENYISGVILYDETIRQNASDGTPFVEMLGKTGVLVGIKVDTGAKPLAGSPRETITEGLDGLRERCAQYRGLGARFTKWRAVITIGDGRPSSNCIHTNAHALARYAALAQEAGLVPIVEPEVLMDGDHDIARCMEVTEAVLNAVHEELHVQGVRLEGMILKPNMVVSGSRCRKQASVEQVAEMTVTCLKRAVPAAVAGIAFLSGGQAGEMATAHLCAMNATFSTPWRLSFSYGRALQADALKLWAGKAQNVARARAAFTHRAHMNVLAASGRWSPEAERSNID